MNGATVPTLEMVDELHRRHAPSQPAYDLVHTHCVIVGTIARQVAQRVNSRFTQRCTTGSAEGWVPPRLIDEHLVVIGGLLHDIGAYEVLERDGSDGGPLAFGDRYILHGLLGYRMLLADGVDESVAQFARNHTGVGLTREQVVAQHLPLPPDDYVPQCLEQEVVMYADKFNSKHNPPWFLSEAAYAKRAARYGKDNLARWRDLVSRYGVPDLKPLSERFHQPII